MGQQQSQSSGAAPQPPQQPRHQQHNETPKTRRESIPTLSANKATARPSLTLESATASTSHSSTLSAKESIAIHHPPPIPLTRVRTGSTASQNIKMGNQESRQASDKNKTPYRASPKPKPINVPVSDKQQQQQQSPAPLLDHESLSPPPPPRQEPVVMPDESYSIASQFSRPPRLPLPIGEEVHTPGSPIISPADLVPIVPLEGLPRRSSVLSSTTLDDDDLGDDLQSLEGGPRPPVPTLLEWREPGEKVYVTGTFAGWDRKFRLHKNGPSKHPGALSAIINLQPGTHHVRFIVDNDMKLSAFMPTAVDFTNFLVNYIEVGPEELHTPPPEPEDAQKLLPPGSEPKPIVGASLGSHPPQILPPTPDLASPATQQEQEDAAKAAATDEPKDSLAEQLIKGTALAPAPPKSYHSKIPQFLIDLDASEESAKYARVNALVNTIPAPPSLPMFLAKSILNGNPPMRDDASVLIMPNHTVLNHLATSSIRNGVLATSGTTRYKQKFLTTIMYKPTSRDGD